jgi:uncharacterized protein
MTGERARFFPAIERKHGGPISMWIERLSELGDAKYPEQIAFLREDHGFSQAHANALVMYTRGSTSSRRIASPEDWFATLDPVPAATSRQIFGATTKHLPELQLVIAWNKPMLRTDDNFYVLGLSVASRHILVNPFSEAVLAQFSGELRGYGLNKRTIKVPLDWTVDEALLVRIATARLAERSQ